MTITPQAVWECECLLGEGPVWLEEEGALLFVDIKCGKLLGLPPVSTVSPASSAGS